MASEATYSQIELVIADGVAQLNLARPEKLNAISVRMRGELLDALERIATDDAVRCVVVSAHGRAFCVGQDLQERAPLLEGDDIDLGSELEAGINRVVEAIVALPQPVICALKGVAVGAGASIALACDILIASEKASLGFGFVGMGLVPDGGATWLLTRKAGPARASAILMQSAHVTARQMSEFGLAWQTVAPEAVDKEAQSVAAHLATSPPYSVRATKALMASAYSQPLDAQLSLEAEAQTLAGRSREYLETLKRFLSPK